MDENNNTLSVFDDFSRRHSAVIKALTTDFDKFLELCSVERDLCLYGNKDGNWEVREPEAMLPTDLPEPLLGINFRKEMDLVAWKRMVAVHTDSWLIAVAFFNATAQKFDAEARKQLFDKINELPTVTEAVADADEKPRARTAESSSKRKSSGSKQLKPQAKASVIVQEKDKFEGEDEDEHENTLCGACGDNEGADEFWIGCDVCDRWFHGECVGITPAKAGRIKRYKCRDCCKKKVRA